MKEKSCECGEISGKAIDNINIEYKGNAIPLGISNSSFLVALKNQPFIGLGFEFKAFIIPKKCSTIKKIN
jgi:hypothetical protein